MERETACQVCGESLAEGANVVYCADCGTAHHLDCFRYVKRCATFACGCERHVPSPSAGRMLALKIDDAGTAWRGTRKIPLPTVSRVWHPQTDIHGDSLDLTTETVRLDLDTPLEQYAQGLGVVALGFACFALSFYGRGHPVSILLSLLSVMLFHLRLVIDCTYVLDNKHTNLLYRRRIAGLETEYLLCHFGEIRSVGVMGKKNGDEDDAQWTYAVLIELPQQVRIQVSDETESFSIAEGLAIHLANHLGAPLHEPHAKRLGMTPGGDIDEVSTQKDVQWTVQVIGKTHGCWASIAQLSWLLFFLSLVR